MSTTKYIVIIGMCLLIGGCVPIAGVKSIAAFIISVIAIVGAGLGLAQQNHEHAVCQKARDLDDVITNHETKYHLSPKGTRVTFEPAHPADTIAKLTTRNDITSHSNQRM